jgi:hypothetical protein
MGRLLNGTLVGTSFYGHHGVSFGIYAKKSVAVTKFGFGSHVRLSEYNATLFRWEGDNSPTIQELETQDGWVEVGKFKGTEIKRKVPEHIKPSVRFLFENTLVHLFLPVASHDHLSG